MSTTPANTTPLVEEENVGSAILAQAMHGKSAKHQSAIRAMMGKDSKAQQKVADAYFKHFDHDDARVETEREVQERKDDYLNLSSHYYDLATGLYEEAWGQSFHFCRFSPSEPFRQAIARHEHYLANTIGIKRDMQVLDVGCGVGGPAREIARFTDANITGLNINDYQNERARMAASREGLEDRLRFVEGDFMKMPFPDNTFDAVYAIEATVHAPNLEGVYSEIFRVLKPGGTFGVYEWLMTEKYIPKNPHHITIRQGIEAGNGVANMVSVPTALSAMRYAGFTLLHHEDLSTRNDTTPWWFPIAGEFKYMGSMWDFFTILRMTKGARSIVNGMLGVLESLRIAPGGCQKTAVGLAKGADSLVAGAKEGLFTPMYLMVGRKDGGATEGI